MNKQIKEEIKKILLRYQNPILRMGNVGQASITLDHNETTKRLAELFEKELAREREKECSRIINFGKIFSTTHFNNKALNDFLFELSELKNK